MQNRYIIISYLSLFFFSNTIGQTVIDPLNIKRDVLNASHIKEITDTSEVTVISASRTAKNLSDLPIEIHVITHETIIKNHYTSLVDVLKSLPGIRVSQPSSGETGESFQIRGLTGNFYTKILINNIPIKPSVVSGMPIGSQLPIRQAERIEVIYGPAAAVYGADAISGVINIITKTAEKGTFARGDISLGQNEYNYINFMIGGKAGRNKNILQYSFYGSKTEFNDMNIKYRKENVYNPLHYLQQKGETFTINGTNYTPLDLSDNLLQQNGISIAEFIQENYAENYEGTLTSPDMEEISSASHMIGVKMNFRGVEISYDNMYRRTHSSIGRSSYLYKYNNPQNYWGEHINRVVIGYNNDWKGFKCNTNLSYLSYAMDNNTSMGLTYLSNTDKAYRYAESHDFFAEQLLTFYPVNNLELLAGLSYQFSGNLPLTNYLHTPFNPLNYKVSGDNHFPEDSLIGEFGFNPLNFHNTSLFLQGYYVMKKFRFMGGIRFDNNSRYGSSLSPRFAALYKFNKQTSLRGSLGFAFKAPPASTAFESLAYHVGENNNQIKYLAIPNANLKPEEYQSYEIGLKGKLFWDIYLNISLFHNKIKNLITDTYFSVDSLQLPFAFTESDSTTVRSKENSSIAESKLYGLQLTIIKKNVISSIKLDAELNLTFAKKSETLPTVGSILGSFKLMPKHLGQLKISLKPFKNTYLHIEYTWMTKWLRLFIPIEKIYEDPFKNVDGYYTVDGLLNYRLGENLQIFGKIINVFNEKYGGLGATGLDIDLPYNPQLGRNIRFGLTYNLN